MHAVKKYDSVSRSHAFVCRPRLAQFRVFAGAMLLVSFASMLGCNRFETEYGSSDGNEGRTSLNGFAGFRESLTRELEPSEVQALGDEWQDAELKQRNLSRLSSRAYQHDAIVWIPESWPPPNLVDIESWMKKWMRSNHRTVVFIVPDEGSTEAYYREAAKLAPPEQRLEYRRRLAEQINNRLLQDSQRDNVTVSKWFTAQALPARQPLGDRRDVSYELQPFSQKITLNTSGLSSGSGSASSDGEAELSDADAADTNDSADEEPTSAEDELGELLDEMGVDKESVLPKRSKITFETLASFNDQTILGRVTSETWKDSQILVVAGGGLLTNFAMTEEPAMKMADTIRQEILNRSRVGSDERVSIGFFNTDKSWVAISDAEPGAPSQTGMELLTTWPISLITMHALFLGVVICLMLLPTFGRARRVIYHRSTHFGNHLNAMAILMRRAGGLDYAKEQINHYMKIVRGESELFPNVPSSTPPRPSETEAPSTKDSKSTPMSVSDASGSNDEPPSDKTSEVDDTVDSASTAGSDTTTDANTDIPAPEQPSSPETPEKTP